MQQYVASVIMSCYGFHLPRWCKNKAAKPHYDRTKIATIFEITKKENYFVILSHPAKGTACQNLSAKDVAHASCANYVPIRVTVF